MPAAAAAAAARRLTPEQQTALTKGAEIYNGLCISCHGLDGTGTPTAELNSDEGAAARRIAARQRPSRLHRQGAAVRRDRPGRRQDLLGRDDSDGHERRRVDRVRGVVRPAQFRQHWRVRDDGGCRARAGGHGRPHDPVDGRRVCGPRCRELLVNDGWKATASHNADAAPRALSLTSWNTGVPQQAGMWFQVELPKAATLTEIQFDSTAGTLQLVGGMVVDPDAPAPGGGRARAARPPRCLRGAPAAPTAGRLPARLQGGGLAGRHRPGRRRRKAPAPAPTP